MVKLLKYICLALFLLGGFYYAERSKALMLSSIESSAATVLDTFENELKLFGEYGKDGKDEFPELEKGDVLRVAIGTIPQDAPLRLLIAISSDCGYCEKSLNFYKSLTELRGDVSIYFVFHMNDDIEHIESMFLQAELPTDNLYPLDLIAAKLYYSPSLVLLGKESQVLLYEKGLLFDEQEDLIVRIVKADAVNSEFSSIYPEIDHDYETHQEELYRTEQDMMRKEIEKRWHAMSKKAGVSKQLLLQINDYIENTDWTGFTRDQAFEHVEAYVKSVFNEEQIARLERFAEDERDAERTLYATAGLARLQILFDFSEDQKDSIFAALYESKGTIDTIDVFRQVLSKEQMHVYLDYLDHPQL